MSENDPTSDTDRARADGADAPRGRGDAPATFRRRVLPLLLVAVGVALVAATDLPTTNVVVALGAAYLFLRIGFAVIGSFARPVPAPPPPGELRRVRIVYRCSICGTEVRMTVANDEVPDPPRHCQDEMELVAPIDE
ncbi:MAG: hypothetical protein S0880_14515 [Actinomycetota bacterium]|nr:hypothetical protein [Actinomycetota bacterium]